jgi:hypothetical protein
MGKIRLREADRAPLRVDGKRLVRERAVDKF